MKILEINSDTISTVKASRTYIPIAEKMLMIQSIIDTCSNVNNGYIEIDSNEIIKVSDLMLISRYTDIELSGDDNADYDYLVANGYMDKISLLFGTDKNMFEKMLERAWQDTLAKNTIEYIFASNIGDVRNSIVGTISHLDLFIDKGDPNKFAKYLGKGIDKIADTISALDMQGILNKTTK